MLAEFPRVRKVHIAGIELELDAVSPAHVNASTEPQAITEEDDDRRALEELLYSSGADPNAFLKTMRGGNR